jgi:alkyl sulfatase BDS1-like metallo-beta-lactamase superfamily hydrolase
MKAQLFGTIYLAAVFAAIVACSFGSTSAAAQPKDAEPATRQANAAVLTSLPFSDRSDFEEAQRGFIASIPDGIMSTDGQRAIWSMKPYAFLTGDAPPTVNPSLWRQAQLNNFHGLFKVIDRLYQIRGLDDSNITIVESDTGLIVIDTLSAMESAKTAMELYFQHRPRRPVVAVIYTHTHVDHFGGVKGVVSEADVRTGSVKVFAPDQFMDYAVADNIIAANATFRRSLYQFGQVLPRSERGQVDAGHGKTVPLGGTLTLIPPTDLIKESYETRIIDGVEIEFHLVPGSEAPSEMTLFFPQFKVLNMAEDTNHTMHNLYALRGAEVRDARLWSRYIGEAMDRYGGGRTEVLIAQHQWPTWGAERIATFLKKQRDMYKFIHDQSVRLLNRAYTPNEIAETLKMPASLANDWSTRGYYGTLSHNAKAVYQKYLGWYDGNPANLSPLPPVDQARRTVEYMGGADAVIARAREDFKAGNYRWVASVLNQVVFADPANRRARDLGADALEQLGYQAEAATWRNAYLMGAMELRSGVTKLPSGASSLDMVRAIPTDAVFDLLAVRLNPEKAEGKTLVINWTFTDTGETFTLNLENSALTNLRGRLAAKADAEFTLARATLNSILVRQTTFPNAIRSGDITFKGEPSKIGELFGMLDDAPADFPIVEPVKAKR